MTNLSSARVLYRQDQLPIFQNRMYATSAEARACPKGDVVLVQDLNTGLVFNSAFSTEVMTYDGNYQNEQAVSPSFRLHLDVVADIIGRTMGAESLVEVGCGKAFFLDLLADRGVDISGFDPSYEGDSPRVQKRYFDASVGMQASGLILRHVLEHIQNPLSFLGSLRDANSGKGRIYIEVPCLDWILQRRAWYDIFYEHVNYFRLGDLQRMFGDVIESGHLFGGQYIYIVAELSSLKVPEIDDKDLVTFPLDFFGGPSFLDGEGSAESIVWGGASKGVIFSLLRERAGRPVSAVIDINPAKQGCYLPATGLPVHAPGEVLPDLAPGSTIYVMNSNYIEEIKAMSDNEFDYVGVDNE
jgi:methyltransferase family protein